MTRLLAEFHPLLTEEAISALHEKRIFSVADFVKMDTQQIVTVARLNFKEARTVKKALLKTFSAKPVNGFDCYKITLANTAIVSTGIESIDKLLKGGLFTGNIYEICGLPASGKTHLVLTLVRNVLRGTQQKIYYFDTKNDFSALKLRQMLNEQNQTKQNGFLGRVMVVQTPTRYNLINALYQLKTDLEKELRLRLVIIDSLSGVLLNSSDYTENNSIINHMVNVIRYIAVEQQVAFIITNLITTWNESGFNSQSQMFENVACGRFWGTVPNTRLKIEKTEQGHKVHVISDLPQTTCGANIQLADNGFC